ncbi:MAG: Lrp/AsnC family transcriptional regulator [Nitrosopumilus sp.]|nr:Lrp/AsnC family transcriptional regulator [Nitrosopumilus sp.]
MEKTDIQILSILLDNCRTSNRKISETLGISSVAVASKIKNMFDNGIITRFSLSIEPLVFGFNIVYFITIGNDSKNIMERLQLIGTPYMTVSCVGGNTICAILTKDDISHVTNTAKKLLDEVRILNIFEAPSFDINQVLTKTDLTILKILLNEPRAKMDYLAKATGFSAKTASRSLEKLQNNDIIHFTLESDPTKLQNYISFAILVNAKKDVKQTASIIEKNLHKSILQKSWLSKNQFVVFFYSDDIYKLDEISTAVRETDGVESIDLFIPKSTSFPQDWVHKEIDLALKSPKLHIGS